MVDGRLNKEFYVWTWKSNWNLWLYLLVIYLFVDFNARISSLDIEFRD